MARNYIEYTHVNPDIDSLDDLLADDNSLMYGIDKTEFLDYDGGTGISNYTRMYSKYTFQEQEDNPENNTLDLLKLNTTLLVPKTLANKEIVSISGKNQFLTQSNFRAFYGESLLQLLKDPKYVAKTRYKWDKSNTLTTIHPHISVWIYVGSLDKVLNVSKYVSNCSTSMTMQGGSFSLQLPPVVSIEDEDLYQFQDQIYSDSNISAGVTGENSEFYFHKVLQMNDIVFIKFEELEIERDERLEDFVLSKSVLSEQFYDMMGLIDDNLRSTNYTNNDTTINITGRDFMKLLIDDGSYFHPLLFIEGSENTFMNEQNDDKLLKRVFATGKYENLFSHSYRTIRNTLQFIINQVGNIGVVDQDVDLFSSYGKRRTKVYRLDNEGADDFTDEYHTGVWQVIKLLIDANVEDRRVVDASVSQPDGSLINQFQKVCQSPYVEFFGDTYGDFYNFIVRQPPFTGSQISSFLNGSPTDESSVTGSVDSLEIKSDALEKEAIDIVLSISQEDVISEYLQWENEQIYSWFELKPQGAFIGQTDNVALAYLPIIYFPEYANKWGCRRLSTVTNYISYKALTGSEGYINRDYFKEAIVNDLKYLLDSNVYLPFTRKGTITLNGDRRFKVGTWVRHEGTGEIYYVEGVSNSFSISRSSIDRTTTLTVSRGMIEKYAKYKKTYKSSDISYFNIVDTEFIRETLMKQLKADDGTTQVRPVVNIKSQMVVNDDVFNFFYERKQFD